MSDPVLPRAFPRLEVRAYVDYTGTEVLLYHRVQNISLGGICIRSAAAEEIGTIVDLVLNFPELEATVAVKGEVVWVNNEPPMDMGIRYVDLDDDRRDTLRRYLSLAKARPASP
ncbi:MAG: PilZ domain-containing protein [Bacteroidota bacterium]